MGQGVRLGTRRPNRAAPRLLASLAAAWALALPQAGTWAGAPRPGLTAAPAVARAYDVILDADFERVPQTLAATCPPAPAVACRCLEALAAWWQIQLDPESRARDAVFLNAIETAIVDAEAWARTEPERAEAALYVGVAYGARAQFRALRDQHLSAARDGKRIKATLERALALDPDLHDAEFGLGLYRYYADVAPAVLKWLRWLLLLPGGNRTEGLRQLERASRYGQLVRGEALYQTHLIYLWYERQFSQALQLVLELQARYPHNPLFRAIEADIRDVYFHDHAGSLAASEALLALALDRKVHRADIAEVRARLNMAVQLAAMGERARARSQLEIIVARRPSAPAGALAHARALLRRMDQEDEERARQARGRTGRARVLDKIARFMLDNANFSSIIYIWYEGGGLRPLVVNS